MVSIQAGDAFAQVFDSLAKEKAGWTQLEGPQGRRLSRDQRQGSRPASIFIATTLVAAART